MYFTVERHAFQQYTTRKDFTFHFVIREKFPLFLEYLSHIKAKFEIILVVYQGPMRKKQDHTHRVGTSLLPIKLSVGDLDLLLDSESSPPDQDPDPALVM